MAKWDEETPVGSGGGYWRAGCVRAWLSKRPYWREWMEYLPMSVPGRRLLTVALLPLALTADLLRMIWIARGLVIAFLVVYLPGLKDGSMGVTWLPFLALLVPHDLKSTPSERTYLLGTNLRDGELHDLRAYFLTCVLLPLLVGVLALPLGHSHWAPAALVLFAATLLFRLGWRGYWRSKFRLGVAGLMIPVTLVTAVGLTGVAMFTTWGRALICLNPYPVAAILAVVGAIGLSIHLANLSEERLLEEEFPLWSSTDDDEDDD
jgi:hypothetical protein